MRILSGTTPAAVIGSGDLHSRSPRCAFCVPPFCPHPG